MIVHLKRFVLDYDTWQTVKKNGQFEFPESLNVEPYTAEGLKRRDDAESSQAQASDPADADSGTAGAAAPTAGPIIAFEGLNQSEGIIWPTAQKSLAYGSVFDFFATVTFANGVVAEGSTTFLTELDPSTLAAAQPMWHANDSATYVLLRASITAAAEANTAGGGEQHTYLTITAKPAPAWNMPHGVNSSHLLCSYKLWVNGVPLGVGPGRNVGGEIQADTYNLTALLALRGGGEASAIAVSAYYLAHGATPDGGSGQPQSTDDHGGVLAVLHSGSDATGNVGANIRTLEWSAFDATIATHPSIGTFKHGDGTGSYLSPRENYLGAHYPFGWRQQLPSQTDAYKHGWSPAKARAPFARMVGPKRAIPVSLRAIPAASFTMLPPATPMTYRYIIDYGRNFQGHVNLSFGSANIVPGHQVIVRLGEQLLTNGSVKWVSESTNRWNDVWTLRGGSRNLPSSSSSASAAAQQHAAHALAMAAAHMPQQQADTTSAAGAAAAAVTKELMPPPPVPPSPPAKPTNGSAPTPGSKRQHVSPPQGTVELQQAEAEIDAQRARTVAAQLEQEEL
jgi:hypothetical protein